MLSFLKKKSAVNGLTSLVINKGGVSFAHVRDGHTQPELVCCEYSASTNPLVEPKRFRDLIEANNLLGSKTSLVLPESSYQIHLVERPEVPDEELTEALRWRIKDLITFDVEQAVIDYIDLPEDAYRSRSRMVYAIAAEQAKVDLWVDWCSEIGLDIAAVDVPELALLNLTEDLADSESGLAVFNIGEEGSSINLLSDSALYFTRNLSYCHASAPENASAAVLELQRSLDYYESQVGKPPCVRLLVMPMQADESPLMNELRYSLALDIHSLDLNNLISSDIDLTESLQNQATVAIAAALRTEFAITEVVK
ncbi:pilus assembly protein PilM [Neptuniibacter sp. QD48_11]|uniref:pilus assembly protein PilM n=1 Tax=Neptuniibacter sp. QD48_11 TaxID=3398211 RepID=UPI0039F5B05D